MQNLYLIFIPLLLAISQLIPERVSSLESMETVPIFASYYTKSVTHHVNKDENVPFDQAIFKPEGGVVYDSQTNAFIIPQAGLYEISYGVSQDRQSALISLTLDGENICGSEQYISASYNLSTTTLIALIDSKQALAITNRSNGPFTLSSALDGVSAHLTIIFLEK
jgi:hypothetical protein